MTNTMIPVEKLREIATRLLDKSRAGEVHWLENPDYHVDFPHSSVVIGWVPSVVDEDSLCLVVRDGRRRLGTLEAAPDSDDWFVLRDLYAEAERCVTGWDSVLGEIESKLHAKGVVGSPPSQQTAKKKNEGYDIPF